MSVKYDRYLIGIRKNHKDMLVRHRKEFMSLLIKMLGDDEEAEKELKNRFGITLMTKTTDANSINVIVDGEVEYRV